MTAPFPKGAAGLLRRIRADRRGAAAVEMALVAPILTLALGITGIGIRHMPVATLDESPKTDNADRESLQ